jgi:hypothetical protein
MDLSGAHSIPARQFRDSPFLTQRRQRHLRLELRPMFLARFHHAPPPASRPMPGGDSLIATCPVFADRLRCHHQRSRTFDELDFSHLSRYRAYVTIAGDQGGTLNGMTVPMGQHGRQRAVLDAFGGQPLGPSEAISARAGRADRRRTTMGP